MLLVIDGSKGTVYVPFHFAEVLANAVLSDLLH